MDLYNLQNFLCKEKSNILRSQGTHPECCYIRLCK